MGRCGSVYLCISLSMQRCVLIVMSMCVGVMSRTVLVVGVLLMVMRWYEFRVEMMCLRVHGRWRCGWWWYEAMMSVSVVLVVSRLVVKDRAIRVRVDVSVDVGGVGVYGSYPCRSIRSITAVVHYYTVLDLELHRHAVRQQWAVVDVAVDDELREVHKVLQITAHDETYTTHNQQHVRKCTIKLCVMQYTSVCE